MSKYINFRVLKVQEEAKGKQVNLEQWDYRDQEV